MMIDLRKIATFFLPAFILADVKQKLPGHWESFSLSKWTGFLYCRRSGCFLIEKRVQESKQFINMRQVPEAGKL
jgi:hypothetical protein